MNWIRTLIAGFSGLLLSACSPAGLYQSAAGPYGVAISDPVMVTDPGQPRDVPLRVVSPVGPGPFPVVVFSHGALCQPQNYAAITDQWVSRGYVVILPNHVDSPNNPVKPTMAVMARSLDSRLSEMAHVLDHLDEIAGRAGIAGKFDRSRVAVAGHSYGTMIAMVAAGLKRDGTPTPTLGRPAQPVSAAVLMSGIGPMSGQFRLDPTDFAGLDLPLMATGGTLDVGNTGGPEIRPWQWRMSPYSLAPAGDKYSVVLDEGDHYLGGLICRSDRGGKPDPEGVAIDGAMTLAFLDAYLKGDDRAKKFLAAADLARLTQGRASLERK